MNKVCQKANRKLIDFARSMPYTDLNKKRILMNAFFNSQFNYSPLIWMFHSRLLENKIRRLHDRCLRTIYKDKQTSFEQLLDQDNSVSIHHKNIQALAIDMYKIVDETAPKIIKEVFILREESNYNIRHTSQFTVPRGAKNWKLIPLDI